MNAGSLRTSCWYLNHIIHRISFLGSSTFCFQARYPMVFIHADHKQLLSLMTCKKYNNKLELKIDLFESLAARFGSVCGPGSPSELSGRSVDNASKDKGYCSSVYGPTERSLCTADAAVSNGAVMSHRERGITLPRPPDAHATTRPRILRRQHPYRTTSKR
ncbi:hypothetical protein RvY_10324 [Ramazzottius varieornatus]|uniref:Uncharacterized protein n=1 Tax=Ramazzottius varieornatus TaxID=947166 RepID=A0A1D1VCE1_RAMVA|nr:hypothetical protein RvY_10324 [Ramazzottius varieornatus]